MELWARALPCWKCHWPDLKGAGLFRRNLFLNSLKTSTLQPKLSLSLSLSIYIYIYIYIYIIFAVGQKRERNIFKWVGPRKDLYFLGFPKFCSDIRLRFQVVAFVWEYKGFELAEKIPERESRNPKKHNNEKPLAYVTTYNKNTPKLLTEMIKNLDELINNNKIQERLDTKKSLKDRDNPKIFRNLTSSTFRENTTQRVTKCNNKRCIIYDIIIEGKSYNFENLETKFKMNKDLSWFSKNIVYINECSKCKEIYQGSTNA